MTETIIETISQKLYKLSAWPRHKPKTDARLTLEYLRAINPVTKSSIRAILFKRSLDSRDCAHRY